MVYFIRYPGPERLAQYLLWGINYHYHARSARVNTKPGIPTKNLFFDKTVLVGPGYQMMTEGLLDGDKGFAIMRSVALAVEHG